MINFIAAVWFGAVLSAVVMFAMGIPFRHSLWVWLAFISVVFVFSQARFR